MRGIFFRPSLEGGLLLFEMSLPNCRRSADISCFSKPFPCSAAESECLSDAMREGASGYNGIQAFESKSVPSRNEKIQ
jgi:hypothetical protein